MGEILPGHVQRVLPGMGGSLGARVSVAVNPVLFTNVLLHES